MTNIYFIRSGEAIKIGRSNDIEQRQKTLQTANSEQLKLLYIIEDVPESFEGHIHGIVKRFNIKGEWFTEDALKHLLAHPWYRENMIEQKD